MNMKNNIENTHMEYELGIADEAKNKVDTRCHFNLKIIKWEQLEGVIANLNCFVLFVANKGNAAKKQSLNPSLVPSATNLKRTSHASLKTS